MDVVASLSQGRTAAAQCGLFTYKSVPVIFELPCTWKLEESDIMGYGAASLGNQFSAFQKNAACTSSGVFSDLHDLRNISNELPSDTVSWSQPKRSENLWNYISICRTEHPVLDTLLQKRYIIF